MSAQRHLIQFNRLTYLNVYLPSVRGIGTRKMYKNAATAGVPALHPSKVEGSNKTRLYSSVNRRINSCKPHCSGELPTLAR